MTDRTHRIRIQLQRVRPPVWRRIEVPGSITLDRLHTVVYVAMGWSGTDGYEFSVGRSSRDPWRKPFVSAAFVEHPAAGSEGQRRGSGGLSGGDAVELVEPPAVESEVRVDDVLTAPGDVLLYRYGIGWDHRLRLERTIDGVSRARCVAGRRAVPPNYLLNGWNYSSLVATAQALAEGTDDDDAAGWLAGHFPGLSPVEVVRTVESFDAEQADAILELLARTDRL